MKLKKNLRNHLLSEERQILSNKKNVVKQYGRPLCGVALQMLFMLTVAYLPALAQGGPPPNPFGGSGTTRLSNAGSNILVIGTWFAFFVGLLSFVLIPVFIKMEWDYKKLIMSGLTGIGGFIIIGAIAYDIVNLTGVSISDPTLP